MLIIVVGNDRKDPACLVIFKQPFREDGTPP